MAWLDDLVARIDTADAGVALAKKISSNDGKSARPVRLTASIAGWIESTRSVVLADPAASRDFLTHRGELDRFIAGAPATTIQVTAWLGSAADALRRDAHRIVRGRKEAELLRALLALLRHVAESRGAEVSEKGLADDLGVDRSVIRRIADSALDHGFIREGVSTMSRGRGIAITSEGIEWLDEEVNAVSTAASAPITAWTLDVSFVHDAAIRTVLERNVRELGVAQREDLHTAAIVLAGAIGEGILYDALVHRKPLAMTAASAPRDKQGVKDIETEQWTFFKYIEVARELKLVGAGTAPMMHGVLRDFRNMIHPKFQVDGQLTPDSAEMKASIAWLEAMARDVRKAP